MGSCCIRLLNSASGISRQPQSKHWKRSNPSPRAQRESRSSPELTCVHRTDPAEAPSRHQSPAPAPALGHRNTGQSTPGVCGVPSERSGCAPYPGFHPGLVCGAPLGHSEHPSSPELPCERRAEPAEPPKIAAERDRTEASTGSDQALPLAHSAKAGPSPSLPACIGPVPRSPPFNSARFTTAVPLIPSPA